MVESLLPDRKSIVAFASIKTTGPRYQRGYARLQRLAVSVRKH
jgi:hypothetical protein